METSINLDIAIEPQPPVQGAKRIKGVCAVKVVVLTGSPHEGGTSAYLAENYILGLREKGHEVERFDAAKMNIHPCIACDHCRKEGNGCVYRDEMQAVYGAVAAADRIAFVTPTYYFGMTAQLKSAIDRLYAINGVVRSAHKEYDLLAVCGDSDDWTMDALVAHYRSIVRYLGGKPLDPLLAYGFYTRDAIEGSDCAQRARAKGGV